jgi:small subunit ribosomal protein S6
MTTATETRIYECMFLISQAEAANLNNVVDHIGEILGKGDAEILALTKWDERRLAYEIDKQKRGVYILAYIAAPTDGIERIERECNLSEHIMRLMVIRADHMSEDQARAADDRDGLAAEAKMRAEKAAAGEAEKKTSARIGAPEPAEMPKKEEASGQDAPKADADAEGSEDDAEAKADDADEPKSE